MQVERGNGEYLAMGPACAAPPPARNPLLLAPPPRNSMDSRDAAFSFSTTSISAGPSSSASSRAPLVQPAFDLVTGGACAA